MNGPVAPTPFDPGLLQVGADLRLRGIDPNPRTHHHVRHGVWMPLPHWNRLVPSQRHSAYVHATALQMDTDGQVFARTSAAALWGMPRIEPWPSTIHTHVEADRARGSRIIRQHLGSPTTAVNRQGILVTSPARTIVDLARTGSLVTAVAAADHALRQALCTRAELVAEVGQLEVRAKGRRAARLVTELADGDSMSAGESLSRVQMFLLDLPRPRLQVEHRDSQGRIGFVDFDWDGVVGEFDGRVKYRVPTGATAAEASEILWLEKNREDRLRRKSLVVRWVWSTAYDRARLGATLAHVGIRPTPRNTWFDLGRLPHAS